MIDIDEMTREQKSAVLAATVGWHWEEDCPRGFAPSLHDENHCEIPNSEGGVLFDDYPNLYLEVNMYLAWRVALWFILCDKLLPGGRVVGTVFQEYCETHFLWGESGAQGAWLDRCLQLAFQAQIAPDKYPA